MAEATERRPITPEFLQGIVGWKVVDCDGEGFNLGTVQTVIFPTANKVTIQLGEHHYLTPDHSAGGGGTPYSTFVWRGHKMSVKHATEIPLFFVLSQKVPGGEYYRIERRGENFIALIPSTT